MLETIYVGMSGLETYSKGLNVISNNVANLNTVGFKGSSLQFADLYYRNDQGEGEVREQLGAGVTSNGTAMNLQQGESRDTGNDLDALIDGAGFFVVREGGVPAFTRDGQFQIDAQGFLVDKASGARVAGYGSGGGLVDLSITGRRASAAKATTEVTFSGNLSTADAQHIVSNVTVYDQQGQSFVWSITFDNTNTTTAGSWQVTVTAADGTQVGSGEIRFTSGRPTIGFDSITVSATGSDGSPFLVALKLTQDATYFAAGSDSTLVVKNQDGYAAGSLMKTTLDASGNLMLSYSNGQTDKAGQLALAWFDSAESLEQVGGNRFAARNGYEPTYGVAHANQFGQIVAGKLESSNVDLSKQFSEMIITQRGYQASSQVVTTANEMIQQLMELRGKR